MPAEAVPKSRLVRADPASLSVSAGVPASRFWTDRVSESTPPTVVRVQNSRYQLLAAMLVVVTFASLMTVPPSRRTQVALKTVPPCAVDLDLELVTRGDVRAG